MQEDITVVIAPHVTAVLSDHAELNPLQRDRYIAMIQAQGHLGGQKESGYGRRSLVETTMGRYKALIGPRLHARSLAGQRTGAAVDVTVLNRVLNTARPNSVRHTARAFGDGRARGSFARTKFHATTPLTAPSTIANKPVAVVEPDVLSR